MGQLHYPIYDTALFGTTASAEHVLFQNGQGSATNKGVGITNMRGNGQFPSSESFILNGFKVHVDDSLTADDIRDLFHGSILTFRYDNQTITQIPLYMASDKNAFSGVNNQGTAADFVALGQEGMGFMFALPINMEGGTGFDVTILQGKAVDNADMDIKVVMDGILTVNSINVT